jgi:DNA-directed RNA polymerase II subunit RPB2
MEFKNDSAGLSEEDYFSVIEKYFSEKGPVFHQFESYEYMINVLIQKIIDECPSIEIVVKQTKYKATFGQVYIEKASFIDETTHKVKNIYPSEARYRDITYDSPVFVDINEEFWELDDSCGIYKKTNELNHKKIFLMKVPTMVRSSMCNLYGLTMDECVEKGECFNDPGGYFIINGKERALVCQERLNYNQVYVFDANDEKIPYVSEIRSMSEETGHSVLIQAKMNREHKNVVFSLPYMSKEVLAGSVFKALGFNSDDIVKFINPSTKEEMIIVQRIIRESILYTNKEKAIKYISSASLNKVEDDEERRIIYTQQVIENEMFPHMGISSSLEKALLLGDMLNKLIRVCLKNRLEDDRDNVSLKRIEGPGVLIADLFRMLLKRYCDNIKKYLEKRQDIITAMSRINNITSSLKHVFSTGNWAVQKNSYVRTGVSQIMSRLTYPATISHLRRVIIPIGKEGKNVKIRQIHPTQAFFVDIIESPEGKSIGIVKNLALSSNITTGCNSILVKELVESCKNFNKCDSFFNEKVDKWYKIYVNGALLGLTEKPYDLYEELSDMRKNCMLSNQVSFYCEDSDKEIRILCDHGRFTRPLLCVKNNSILLKKEMIKTMTWSDLVENDIIRYIDSNEVESSVISMYPDDLKKYSDQKYDYCEIHPSLMLGVCSSVIPYPEHNQNPRLVYQSSMVKQALGVYSLAFKERFDTVTHVMHYPQKPLVSTKYDKMLKYDEMLTGCNPIVAILTYGGWNQEDSVMMNKSSVDRGMFVHTCYKTLQCEENKKSNCSFEKIEIPSGKCQNKTMNYSKLGLNGIVPKGTPVYKGDVLIGKVLTKVQKDEEEDKTECSVVIGNGEEGIVDDIWEGFNDEGNKMVKVRIRQLRIPEVGDKVASRSSQKGVCGLLLSQEDMPFTQQGIVPDIMINPNCMPSRMTMSQLIETLLGKTCSLSGKLGDSTGFCSSSIDPTNRICEELKTLGYERHGNEKMYCGYTGEILEAEVFIGPTYYQRLKHLVRDKMHSRSRGNVTMMHHQPSEGRSRDGGLRTGEMERDALIAHGGASFIKETFFDMSDVYQVNVCEKCGGIVSSAKECRACKKTDIAKVNIPYCTKLLFQELQAMGVSININVK